MVLEPMSTPSETVRDGVEKDKFRAGLDVEPSLGKRKREGEGEGEKKKKPGLKKAKGPNPLSVKKPKKRAAESGSGTAPKKAKSKTDAGEATEGNGDVPENADGEEAGVAKTKRRRRHHKSAPREGQEDSAPAAEAGQAMEVEA